MLTARPWGSDAHFELRANASAVLLHTLAKDPQLMSTAIELAWVPERRFNELAAPQGYGFDRRAAVSEQSFVTPHHVLAKVQQDNPLSAILNSLAVHYKPLGIDMHALAAEVFFTTASLAALDHWTSRSCPQSAVEAICRLAKEDNPLLKPGAYRYFNSDGKRWSFC